MSKFWGTSLFVMVAFVIIVSAIPNQMAFQAKITDTLGVGINDTVEMKFIILDDSTGGTSLWSETHDSVVVHKGLFDVVLGQINPLNLAFNVNYWLQIIVDDDTLAPLQQMLTEAYAFRARYADSSDFAYSAFYADSVLNFPDTISLTQLNVNFIDPLPGFSAVNFSAPVIVPQWFRTDTIYSNQIFTNWIDPVTAEDTVKFSGPIWAPNLGSGGLVPDPLQINQLFVNWIDPWEPFDTVKFSGPIAVNQIYADLIDPWRSEFVEFSSPIIVPGFVQTEQIYTNMIDPMPGSGTTQIGFSAPVIVPRWFRTDTIYSTQIFTDWIDPVMMDDTVKFSGPIAVNQIYVDLIDPWMSEFVGFSAPIIVPGFVQTDQIFTNAIDPIRDGDTIFISGPIELIQIYADSIDPYLGDTIFFSGPIWAPNWPSGGTAAADSDWNRTGNYVFTFNNSDSVGIGTTTPGQKLDVHGTGRFTDATLDTVLKVINTHRLGGSCFGEYIKAHNQGVEITDYAIGLKIDAKSDASSATGIQSYAETTADDATGGYFSGLNHGLANAYGIHTIGYNDNNGIGMGIYSVGMATQDKSYGIYSKGFVTNSTTDTTFGGWFSAQSFQGGPEIGIYASTNADPSAGIWAAILDGNVKITGGLHDGNNFGTAGQVLTADGGGNFAWADPTGGTSPTGFDTLWTIDHDPTDTMVAMAQFKIHGELIVDSVQAVGDTIELDDHIRVHGDATIDNGISLLGGGTQVGDPYRTDWEPKYVVTVGQDNADFTDLLEAIDTINSKGWTDVLIDVAPGIYGAAGTIININPDVHLRGSGMYSTDIIGTITIVGIASQIHFTGDGTFVNVIGRASYCWFECDVLLGPALSLETTNTINYSIFKGSPTNALTLIGPGGRLSDCHVFIQTHFLADEGIWEISDNEFGSIDALAPIIIEPGAATVHFNGNKVTYMAFLTIAAGNFVYIESNFFLYCINTAILITGGQVEIKANHFVDCNVGAINLTSAIVNILSNDILHCGDPMGIEHPAIKAYYSSTPFEVNIIGNHIDGTSYPVASPGVFMSGEPGCTGSLKDNIIERHGYGAIIIGMNNDPTYPKMPIDNNIIYRNQVDGIQLNTGNYLVVHNNLYNNYTGGAGFDLNDSGSNLVVSHNVVDLYNSLISPIPGALNTDSNGMLWNFGTPGWTTGQLP